MKIENMKERVNKLFITYNLFAVILNAEIQGVTETTETADKSKILYTFKLLMTLLRSFKTFVFYLHVLLKHSLKKLRR